MDSRGRQFYRRVVDTRASTPGLDPSSGTSWEILDNFHIVSELQLPLCKMRLITVPASWVTVKIKFDNKCTVLSPVLDLWFYVLWVHSKCSTKR